MSDNRQRDQFGRPERIMAIALTAAVWCVLGAGSVWPPRARSVWPPLDSDGARWIWDRVEPLVEAVGIPADRVTQVIDWYHAVQVLHSIADARKSWSAKDRERWIRRAKKRLHRGEIDELVGMIRALARGRRARDVGKHVNYFERNQARMQYSTFEAAKIPRGSGAVESMIRRVVNLRLKGNAKYWLESNAEGMLLVRSYLKAGRLEDLLDWSAVDAARWWQPGVASAPSTPLGLGG